MLRKTLKSFQLPEAVGSQGEMYTVSGSSIPTLFWPNGRWCIEGNMFLINLVRQNCSIRGGGGTVYTYATQLTHLLRFCYSAKIALNNVSDSNFIEFVASLKKGEINSREKNARSVRKIGKICLQFLAFVGDLHGINNYVSPTGRIRIRYEVGRYNTVINCNKSMVHRSLPANSPERRVHAISGNTISALCTAAVDSSHSFFQLNRRLVMIKMLEMTGCRRSELVDIKVGDIKRALACFEPFLTVPSIKRGGNKTEKRVVPVKRSDLEFVDDYIDKQRSIIIRRTCKKYNDDQKVLIGIQTGRGISATHVARELRDLGNVAGLSSESITPHSFRHRFATKLFVRLLELHEFSCVDDFRRALINTESLKTKVMQWTGHRSVRSLERYIDAAFAEFTNEEDLMEAYLNDFR